MNDAKNAGISPLVALGAPTFNPGPVQSFDVGGPTQSNAFAGAGDSLSRMGQDISRAAMQAQTDKVRSDTILQAEAMRNNSVVAQSEAERNMADAALARRRADMLGATSFPPMTNGTPYGQTLVGPIKAEPSKQIVGGGAEASDTPAVKWVQGPDGGVRMQPSLGTSSGTTGEDLGWSLNYRLPQAYDSRMSPPRSMLPSGSSHWELGWNGQWYAKSGGGNPVTLYDRLERGIRDVGRSWSYPDSRVLVP